MVRNKNVLSRVMIMTYRKNTNETKYFDYLTPASLIRHHQTTALNNEILNGTNFPFRVEDDGRSGDQMFPYFIKSWTASVMAKLGLLSAPKLQDAVNVAAAIVAVTKAFLEERI